MDPVALLALLEVQALINAVYRTLVVGDRLGRLWWGRIMCSLWLLGILVYTTSVGNIDQVYGGKFVVGIRPDVCHRPCLCCCECSICDISIDPGLLD